ncbi:hypothetical protein TheveDRAFT_1467 [Thermanaerovibrio velox DSM 12556]|uniref:Uncharacterized protein n=1 Tax=Thermanaerovibrio velox DSM 12556 TaxID=926567 RepID=H0UPF4_9BACT|nr:hypothetical protein [Thermanaerovibrio velox]EHM10585.1 hypothetical protein TheveDRAFT_1467 [Thermanaerovibrio velox DSM 12556]
MTRPLALLSGPKDERLTLRKEAAEAEAKGTEVGKEEGTPQDPMEEVRRAEERIYASMDRVMVTHHRTVQRSMEEYKLKLKKKILEAEIKRRRDQDQELLSLAVVEALNHRNLLKAKVLKRNAPHGGRR